MELLWFFSGRRTAAFDCNQEGTGGTRENSQIEVSRSTIFGSFFLIIELIELVFSLELDKLR